MKKTLLLLVSAILLLSCSNSGGDDDSSLSLQEKISLRTDTDFLLPHRISKEFTEEKIAVFGDSISVYWPYKFAEITGKQVDDFAVGGASYTISKSAIPSIEEQITRVDLSKYNMVIAAGGTNDWQAEVPMQEFRERLSKIYSNLSSRFKTRIVIVIPIHYVDKHMKIDKIDSSFRKLTSYRAIIYEEAVKHGFDIINASLFEEFPTTDNETAKIYMNTLNNDFLHPSYPAGTDRLAERIYGVLKDGK